MNECNYDEVLTLSEYVEKEISEQKINMELNEDLLAHFLFIDEILQEMDFDGYDYTDFKEIKVNEKTYYRIDLDQRGVCITDYWTYLVWDPQNNIMVKNEGGMIGESTERYWDEYGNEIIIRGSRIDVDFNNDSLLQMLMAGINYITAQSIIDLRKKGEITKEKINNLLDSNVSNDTYFLRVYHR